jgi:UDP-2,4-diacetamido-2,4,6-trideoxy-beta-L-altropyranose hydrolase
MVNGITVVFRVDASLAIGSGHVMRCLALADGLRAEGAECHFICRAHPGHLLDIIRSKGFSAYSLGLADVSAVADLRAQDANRPAHSNWLGVTQCQDAEASATILETLRPDWLVVDHYALDAQWEMSVRKYFTRLLVIDDLADRKHICDLLVDQNLGHTEQDYSALVSNDCQLLIGAQYALLRPEFSQLRTQSLKRRGSSQLKHILITMGGVDQQNATGAVLLALKSCLLPANCSINVIMGLKAPCIAEVIEVAANIPWSTEVFLNVTDMGEHMAAADLVIGAAGSTSWERCCLGVPTVMVILADNQKSGARALQHSGSVILIEHVSDISVLLSSVIHTLTHGNTLQVMSEKASKVSDGLGVQRVIRELGYRNV